jgi:biopolymer transport protein ExbD
MANPDYYAHPECGYHDRFKANWALYSQGRTTSNFSSGETVSAQGRFDESRSANIPMHSGTYVLDIEFLEMSPCAPQLTAILSVWADGTSYDYYSFVLDFAVVLFPGVGLVLLVRTPAKLLRQPAARIRREELYIFNPLEYVHRSSLRKLRKVPIFFRPPDFGMVFAVAILPSFFFFMVIILHGFGQSRAGIRLSLTMPKDTPMNTDSRAEGFLVWLDDHGNYFLNSKQAPREHLQRAIQDELAKRAEWTVYFEAAPSAKFQDAAFAMDAIQSAHGKLVWLTPAARALLSKPLP